MHLEMTDDETAALIKELNDIVESDRHPFSPRIRIPSAILAKLRPETVRDPSPPQPPDIHSVVPAPWSNYWSMTKSLNPGCSLLRGLPPSARSTTNPTWPIDPP
jgi:hypothetical protein